MPVNKIKASGAIAPQYQAIIRIRGLRSNKEAKGTSSATGPGAIAAWFGSGWIDTISSGAAEVMHDEDCPPLALLQAGGIGGAGLSAACKLPLKASSKTPGKIRKRMTNPEIEAKGVKVP